MTALTFMLASLAVWRVTHLLAAEDGPFDIIANLRRAAGSSVLGKLLDCFYCLSLWVAVPFAWWLQSMWSARVLLWLALSAAAILMNRLADRFAPDPPVYFEAPETSLEPDPHETENV